MQAYYHTEGRAAPLPDDGDPLTDREWQHEYTIKDHLGNGRAYFRAGDTNNGEDCVVVLQEAHYYPFGLSITGLSQQHEQEPTNKYQYNGKELNDEFGLHWNDYGARWYDSAAARWWSTDPLAESFYAWSPFNYTYDNPIRFIDPDGTTPNEYDRNLLTGEYQEVSKKGGNDRDYVNYYVEDDTGTRHEAGTEVIENTTDKNKNEVASDGPGEWTFGGHGLEDESVLDYIPNPKSLIKGGTKYAAKLGAKKTANKLGPNKRASGDHTTFGRDKDGNVYKYETYEKTKTGHFNPIKRFDGGKKDRSAGKPHVNKNTGEAVPTPHVQGKKISGGVRAPRPDEIPNNKRFNK